MIDLRQNYRVGDIIAHEDILNGNINYIELEPYVWVIVGFTETGVLAHAICTQKSITGDTEIGDSVSFDSYDLGPAVVIGNINDMSANSEPRCCTCGKDKSGDAGRHSGWCDIK